MSDLMGETTPETPNGLRAYETVGQFLEEDGWHPQPVEDMYVYRCAFAGANGEVSCFAQVRPDLEQFIFYAVLPVRVPENTRPAAAEFLTRANYGLRVGNFEIDLDDGEIRYKSSVDFEGAELLSVFVRNAIYPAVQTMDRYMTGIMAVIYGSKSPADAIAEIEA